MHQSHNVMSTKHYTRDISYVILQYQEALGGVCDVYRLQSNAEVDVLSHLEPEVWPSRMTSTSPIEQLRSRLTRPQDTTQVIRDETMKEVPADEQSTQNEAYDAHHPAPVSSWASLRPVIESMYIYRGFKLKQIRRHMENHYKFHATYVLEAIVNVYTD